MSDKGGFYPHCTLCITDPGKSDPSTKPTDLDFAKTLSLLQKTRQPFHKLVDDFISLIKDEEDNRPPCTRALLQHAPMALPQLRFRP